MVRKPLKISGRFFLFSRKNRQFFGRRGVFDEGEGPVEYMDWTPYPSGAMGFDSIKSARAMQRKLGADGIRVAIVDRNRKVVMD